MTLIVMCQRACSSRLHGQSSLDSIQRLNRTLFISREHDRNGYRSAAISVTAELIQPPTGLPVKLTVVLSSVVKRGLAQRGTLSRMAAIGCLMHQRPWVEHFERILEELDQASLHIHW